MLCLIAAPGQWEHSTVNWNLRGLWTKGHSSSLKLISPGYFATATKVHATHQFGSLNYISISHVHWVHVQAHKCMCKHTGACALSHTHIHTERHKDGCTYIRKEHVSQKTNSGKTMCSMALPPWRILLTWEQLKTEDHSGKKIREEQTLGVITPWNRHREAGMTL